MKPNIVTLKEFWNIVYSTEVLALLVMIGNLDINIGHSLI